jgi:ABC-type sugar transport system ATPase subunit
MSDPQRSTSGASAAPTPVVEVRGLVKSYGPVRALDGADLEVYPREVHALLGDNGAGKSTMIKALSGALIPDGGTIRIDGVEQRFSSPRDAQLAGIETVYQDLALAQTLDAADNVFVGREKMAPGWRGRLGFIDRGAMRRETQEQLDTLGIQLKSLRVPVGSLSGGQRQAVAVARAAVWGGKLLILDEPAAALGVKQTAQVMDLIERVRDEQGLSVILITHNLPEVFQVADRVSVMRLGKRVHVGSVADATTESLIAAMTGVSEQALREVMS